MRNVPPQAAMIAAVGILGVGAAWAGSMFLADPEPSKIQPRQLRELAQKVQNAPAQAPTLVVPASAVVRPQVVAPEKPRKTATVTHGVQRIPIVQPRAGKSAPPTPPAPPAAPEDPVKNLALMGVTHESNTDRAWLVDLASKEKETVEVGGTAFGFTVKKISGETVTLGRGPSEYTLRLGEKQLPVIVASAGGDSSGGGEDGEDGNPFGRGRDGRDGRNPFGGPGGFGGFGGRFAGGFPGGGFGGSNGWPGRSWGGGDSGRSWGGGGDSSRWSSNSSSNNSSRGSWGGGSSWNSGRSSFGGGGFSGGFGGGGFGGFTGSSNRSSQTGFAGATSTSNPQTSRRNGARLTGGVTSAQETPAAISNPQTQRRNGSSSGQAFGQENQNNRNSINNNSNNRLGYGR